MQRTLPQGGLVAILTLALGLPLSGLFGPAGPAAVCADAVRTAVDDPQGLKEARSRARLLHEAFHGTLLVMHRDFFHEEDSLSIPSRSLEDVFRGMADNCGVQIHWLAVNAQAMSVDNKPRDAFERAAVTELAAGKESFEQVLDGVYRYAGAIQLSSQCLKCHLPSRSSNKDRTAGLVIAMPLQPAGK